MLTVTLEPNGTFDSGAIAVDDDADWVEICRIPANGGPVSVRLDVGAAGKVGHIAIAVAAQRDGDLLIASQFAGHPGFATGTISASGASYLDLPAGPVDYAIYAALAAGDDETTLRVRGTVFPRH